jgi:hypothetical protein
MSKLQPVKNDTEEETQLSLSLNPLNPTPASEESPGLATASTLEPSSPSVGVVVRRASAVRLGKGGAHFFERGASFHGNKETHEKHEKHGKHGKHEKKHKHKKRRRKKSRGMNVHKALMKRKRSPPAATYAYTQGPLL